MILLAVEIAAGVAIVGAGVPQLTGDTGAAAAGGRGAAGVIAVVIVGVFPKKNDIISTTRGINNRPHETSSISLNERYAIKNRITSPENTWGVTKDGRL